MAAEGEAASPTALYESAARDACRLGLWVPPAGPTVFPNVQMPMDGSIDQFFRQQTPDTGQEPDRKTLAATVGRLFDMTGTDILMTHSRLAEMP